MFSYCGSILILLSVFLVSELICKETDEVISEPEQLFNNLISKNGTKENKHFQLIFPGTRWCRDGNKAKDEKELGHFKETDACCREHDHCSDVILAGESNHGLSNKSPFTRLSCSCDEKLYNCLSSLCSTLAASIGITYFDILRPNCFEYDAPITCTKEESHLIFGKRCLKYEVDKTKPKTWHWKEPKKFDISDSSEHIAECFKDVTVGKIKATEEQISKFTHEHGIEKLEDMCSKLALDSWIRRHICHQNVTNIIDKKK